MKGLATPVFLLIMCLGLVWFANTNSETVDGWFEGVKIIDSTLVNEISTIPEGSYYIVAKSSGTSEKLTSGAIPTASADDMFIHKGYTYVYIAPVNATAIRYGLEGNQWYIYAKPATDEAPLTKINGVVVIQETLEELMQKEQDHVIGDEQQKQPTETTPSQEPQTVPPQSQGNQIDDSLFNDWSGSSGPSWGDEGNSGPSWGDSVSSGPSW